MVIDLYRDLVEMCSQALAAEGVTVSPGDDPDKVCFGYFNLHRRLIPARPRKVHRADTLLVPPAHALAFNALRGKIERGDSLSPHLSRRLKNRDFNDLLLNDWDIHHLHLDPDGTRELIFARFTDDDAYLVALLDHSSWTMHAMLETILRNWPELLTSHRLTGITGDTFTDDEIGTLRSKRANTCIMLSDRFTYRPMGGGYAASGLNVDVRRTVDIYTAAAEDAQEWVLSNIAELRRKASEKGREIPDDPEFKLVGLEQVDGVAVAHVLEAHAQVVFEIPTVGWG